MMQSMVLHGTSRPMSVRDQVRRNSYVRKFGLANRSTLNFDLRNYQNIVTVNTCNNNKKLLVEDLMQNDDCDGKSRVRCRVIV